MSIHYKVLGAPFHDNALYATVEPGQSVHRILFDCGRHCLDSLRNAEIMAIDQVFFSHYHIDHISGFDTFLRLNYQRETKPVYLWGPEGAIDIIEHRLRGVTWDLVTDLPGEWYVSEITTDSIHTVLFRTREAFSRRHQMEKRTYESTILRTDDYRVETAGLQHHVISLAYKIVEAPSQNVDKSRLKNLAIEPGPWLSNLKDFAKDDTLLIQTNGEEYRLGELREHLLVAKPGESLVYLTDFIYNEENRETLLPFLQHCDTMVCESTYAAAHRDLAEENYHLTARQAAQLAREAEVKTLILFHLSDRYMDSGRRPLLDEAREILPETYFPESWDGQ